MKGEAFIRAQTRLLQPSLVPELHLWLADEVTPLWHATEAFLEEQNCAPPYWAFAWPGGQAIARYLLDHPDSVRGKRVFELAAGCGVGGLAALKAGAVALTANEIDPLALTALALNAAANGMVLSLAEGDWTGRDLSDFDLILAGDICYEQAMTRRLLAWLRGQVAQGAEVLLADPGRAYLPQAGLERLAAYTIPTTHDLENVTVRETTLYRLLAA